MFGGTYIISTFRGTVNTHIYEKGSEFYCFMST
nr:MAG TPA: hypothetical protein [Caudoviricetes sp.]